MTYCTAKINWHHFKSILKYIMTKKAEYMDNQILKK